MEKLEDCTVLYVLESRSFLHIRGKQVSCCDWSRHWALRPRVEYLWQMVKMIFRFTHLLFLRIVNFMCQWVDIDQEIYRFLVTNITSGYLSSLSSCFQMWLAFESANSGKWMAFPKSALSNLLEAWVEQKEEREICTFFCFTARDGTCHLIFFYSWAGI